MGSPQYAMQPLCPRNSTGETHSRRTHSGAPLPPLERTGARPLSPLADKQRRFPAPSLLCLGWKTLPDLLGCSATSEVWPGPVCASGGLFSLRQQRLLAIAGSFQQVRELRHGAQGVEQRVVLQVRVRAVILLDGHADHVHGSVLLPNERKHRALHVNGLGIVARRYRGRVFLRDAV